MSTTVVVQPPMGTHAIHAARSPDARDRRRAVSHALDRKDPSLFNLVVMANLALREDLHRYYRKNSEDQDRGRDNLRDDRLF